MPTLAAARNSPAATMPSNQDVAAASTDPSTASSANAATCTFSTAASTTTAITGGDYEQQHQQHQQHQRQHLQQLQQEHEEQRQFYQHGIVNAHQHYDVLPPPPLAAPSTAASASPASVETSLAAFNGNSNLNVAKASFTAGGALGGGAVSGSNGNGSHTANANAPTAGGGAVCSPAAAPMVSALKKTASASALQGLHASREDVASLGGASSVYSQLSSTNNSSNINNNNCMLGSNGNGGSGSGSGVAKENKDNYIQSNDNGGTGVNCDLGGSESSFCNRENDDPGDGLGPLPPKWETAYTERGELYFIDHNTGTSHWLDPRLSKFQKKSLEDCGDDELPYGWEKIEDSLYGTYYIDHVNRRTQYENPVLEAKRRAAEQKQQRQQVQTPMESISVNGEVGGSNEALGRGGSGSANALLPPPPSLHYDVLNRNLPPHKFTRNPSELLGERITTSLIKSARGLGITIVGGDDSADEFLQIKSIVPNGPAWIDGQLQTGDILVYVNDTCVLGFTHHEMVNIFQSILAGETVTLEVCRGYPLPFDPNDPNTEVVTTIAVESVSAEPEKRRRLAMDLNLDGNYNFLDVSGNSNGAKSNGGTDLANSGFILMKKPEVHTITIVKGTMGFGFTIADSAYGQKVKKILDRNCCAHLQEGDVLLEINNMSVQNKSHLEVVQLLKDCSKTDTTIVKIQRGTASSSPSGNVCKLRKNFTGSKGLFRSKTPTADLYSTQQKEILPIRPKTPLVDTRRARVKTPSNELNSDMEVAEATSNGRGRTTALEVDVGLERSLAESKAQVDNKSTNSLQEIEAINKEIPFMDPYPKLVTSLSERLAGVTLLGESMRGGGAGTSLGNGGAVMHAGHEYPRGTYEHQDYVTAGHHGYGGDYNPIYGLSGSPLNPNAHHGNPGPAQQLPSAAHLSSRSFPSTTTTPLSLLAPSMQHHENCGCYECQEFHSHKYHAQQPLLYGAGLNGSHHPQMLPSQASANSSAPTATGHHHAQYSPASLHAGSTTMPLQMENERMQKRVNELLSDRRRVGFSPLDHAHYNLGGGYKPAQNQLLQQQQQQLQHAHANWSGNLNGGYSTSQPPPTHGGVGMNTGAGLSPMLRNGHMDLIVAEDTSTQYELTEVTLERQALGFGFRIVGGTEEGSQVTVGHIVPGGAADNDHRITTGDEILSIDGINVVNSSHHKVVSLMGEAALRGQVTMILRRRIAAHALGIQPPQQQQSPVSILRPTVHYPYDVIVSRHENEGFGFVIISSSNQFYGSTIGKLIPGSPADRCNELKVGDRIIAVNRIDIAGMSHGDVVNLIKDSGLHVRLTIGCPKEGAAFGGAGGNNSMHSASQDSPGQMGHHTPLLIQQHQQPLANDTQTYFERPRTAAAAAAGIMTHQQPQL